MHISFTMHCGRSTHVHPVVSSKVENVVCSQPSTCLTCWPWCYSVQSCHRMTSVTHGSLSSLPLQPTLLLLTYWHKFCLTVLFCCPSVCSPLSVLWFTFLLLSVLQGLYFVFFFHPSSLTSPLMQSSLFFFLTPSLIPLLLFPDLPWWALAASRRWQLY